MMKNIKKLSLFSILSIIIWIPIYTFSALTVSSGLLFFGCLYYFGNRSAKKSRSIKRLTLSSSQTPAGIPSLNQTLENFYQALGIKS